MERRRLPWTACALGLLRSSQTWAVDNDGDGWDESEDCDDRLSQMYPGAFEYCDGLDNDCDGVRDDVGRIKIEASLGSGVQEVPSGLVVEEGSGLDWPLFVWAEGCVDLLVDASDLSDTNVGGPCELSCDPGKGFCTSGGCYFAEPGEARVSAVAYLEGVAVVSQEFGFTVEDMPPVIDRDSLAANDVFWKVLYTDDDEFRQVDVMLDPFREPVAVEVEGLREVGVIRHSFWFVPAEQEVGSHLVAVTVRDDEGNEDRVDDLVVDIAERATDAGCLGCGLAGGFDAPGWLAGAVVLGAMRRRGQRP